MEHSIYQSAVVNEFMFIDMVHSVASCTGFLHEEQMPSSTRSCWRGCLWAKTTDPHSQLPDWL